MKRTQLAPFPVDACSLTTTCVLFFLLARQDPVDAWVAPPTYHPTAKSSTTGLTNGFWDWLNPTAAKTEESSSNASNDNKQDLFANWFQPGGTTRSKKDDDHGKVAVTESSSSQENKDTHIDSSSNTDQNIDTVTADANGDEILPKFIVDQLEAYDKDAHAEQSNTMTKVDPSSSPPSDEDVMMEILNASPPISTDPEKQTKERKQKQEQPAAQTGTILHRGHVKWFNPRKGFGFIAMDESNSKEDIFVHQSAIVSDLGYYRKLVAGEPVEFSLQPGKNGRVCAAHVTGPRGKPVHSILQQQLDGPPRSAEH